MLAYHARAESPYFWWEVSCLATVCPDHGLRTAIAPAVRQTRGRAAPSFLHIPERRMAWAWPDMVEAFLAWSRCPFGVSGPYSMPCWIEFRRTYRQTLCHHMNSARYELQRKTKHACWGSGAIQTPELPFWPQPRHADKICAVNAGSKSLSLMSIASTSWVRGTQGIGLAASGLAWPDRG